MILKPEVGVFVISASTFLAFHPQIFKWNNKDMNQ